MNKEQITTALRDATIALMYIYPSIDDAHLELVTEALESNDKLIDYLTYGE
jgi:hypothetical protein